MIHFPSFLFPGRKGFVFVLFLFFHLEDSREEHYRGESGWLRRERMGRGRFLAELNVLICSEISDLKKYFSAAHLKKLWV